MYSNTCGGCGGSLSGRQRSWCSEVCRERNRPVRKRPSGYARMTEDQREDRSAQRRAPVERIACGVDGEGHEGSYFLLAAASDDGFSRQIWSDRPDGLSTTDCFNFLVDLPDHFTYWGFSFGYDVNMMLRDVPTKRLEQLHESGWLRWRPFTLHWVPGKMLQLSKARYDRRAGEWKTEHTIRIWDMYPWQGQSFVSWLKENSLGDAGTFPVLEYMKLTRPDFDQANRTEITDYCLEECRLLSRGANQVHRMLNDTGLRLHKFYSPATVSKTLMSTNGVASCMSKENPAPAVLEAAFRSAYFGGRAETTQVGPIEGPLFLHDIRSAYPTAMLQLPCLAHGCWEDDDEASPWSITDVSWQAPARALWGPLPVRPRVGSLKWPIQGRGWFWQPEIDGVARLARFTVHRRMVWRQDCDHRPFAYIGDLYDERAALKAVGDPRQYVLKIALNASYGATAEHRRRGMKQEPRWQEKAWAGWITAFTRGMIGEQLGPDVVMVATDGVLSRSRLPVVEGKALGEWEVEEYDRGFVVGPGVYFLERGGVWSKFKSRGINARAFRVEDFQQVWKDQGREGVLPIPQTRFVGLGTALHRINGMEPPGARMWRQFVDFTPARSLSLVPRRRWLTKDRWDGRSLAPTPASMKKGESADLLQSARLRVLLRRESDPEKRTMLLLALSGMSDSEDGGEREFFAETDQPWN